MSISVRRSAVLVPMLALTLASAAIFAARGHAASVKTCSGSSTCFSVTLLPGNVTVGSDGVAVARFQNQGSATATHTVITLTLPSALTPGAVSTSAPATCSGLSCSFGSVPGGTSVKMFVRFTANAPASGLTASATLGFDEANGNTGSPSNDTFTATSNAISTSSSGTTSVAGKCTAASSDSLKAFISTQAITASYSSALSTLGLPCTPVDAGVESTLLQGFTEHPVFVDLPQLSGTGLASVTLDFTTLPQGTNFNKFVLYEVPATGSPFPVQPCVSGAPPSGDACVFSRSKLGSSGAELVLRVVGTGGDPRFVG